jgi:hypothetical protein
VCVCVRKGTQRENKFIERERESSRCIKQRFYISGDILLKDFSIMFIYESI